MMAGASEGKKESPNLTMEKISEIENLRYLNSKKANAKSSELTVASIQRA